MNSINPPTTNVVPDVLSPRDLISRIRDTSPKTTLPKRLFAEKTLGRKNRRIRHFAEKFFLAYLPNTVKNLILCQDFKT